MLVSTRPSPAPAFPGWVFRCPPSSAQAPEVKSSLVGFMLPTSHVPLCVRGQPETGSDRSPWRGLLGQPALPQLPKPPGGLWTTVSPHLSPAAARWARGGSWLVLRQRDGDTGEGTVLTSCKMGSLEKKSPRQLPARRRHPHRVPSVSYRPFFQLALCRQNTENLPFPQVTGSAARTRLTWPCSFLPGSRQLGGGYSLSLRAMVLLFVEAMGHGSAAS